MFRPLFVALLALLFCVPSYGATKKKKSPSQTPATVVAKAVPIPSAAGKPNVLFIMVDDLNDWVGWLGGHPQTKTPNMDRLAKMGMRFTNAHTVYSLCNPSRTAMLTGMAPWNSGVYGNEQDWRRSVQVTGKATLPEFYKSKGYTTAAGGKVFHANHGGPEGRLAGWHGGRRGFELDSAWDARFPMAGVQLADLPVHTGQNFNGLDIWHWDWSGIDVPDEKTEDAQTVEWAASYLAKQPAKAKQPFFLTVGLYRPHSPWYVPKAYLEQFPLDSIQLPPTKADDLDDVPAIAKDYAGKPGDYHELITKKNLWKDAVRGYLASIAFADTQVGHLLDALEKTAVAKNTIICLTSDHGWYLGEKQMWHKGRLWERGSHVPLTLYVPGVTSADSVCNQPVSTLDIYPTLAELSKLQAPAHLDGESLVPLLSDPAAKRTRPAITVMGGGEKVSYAARTERYRYIRYADASEELYDHSNDPNEWTNLAAKPEFSGLKQELAATLPKEWHSAQRTPQQVAAHTGADGSMNFMLQAGDELSGIAAPQIMGRGIAVDTSFEYVSAIDQDSTLLSQGGGNNGWVLHLVAGQPTLTMTNEGKPIAFSLPALKPGFASVRFMISGNGIIYLAAEGQSQIAEACPFPAGFPKQPEGPLLVGKSFGPLNVQNYPNSTPFDGVMHQVMVTVLP